MQQPVDGASVQDCSNRSAIIQTHEDIELYDAKSALVVLAQRSRLVRHLYR